MKAETIYIQLTLAAPVHIGCGEVYEPMGFVVNHSVQELISFPPSSFMEQLTSDELTKLSEICRKGTVSSIQELYKFMQLHKEYAKGTPISISSGFANHYKEVIEKPANLFAKELNKFEVNRTFFNPIQDTPVIPGSSIKGAIRTAVLSYRNKGASQPSFRGRSGAKELEKNLLGGTFATDPFRLIKVSDFSPIGEVKRKICYAVNAKKRLTKKESSTVAQMQEIIEPGSRFWGSITILPAPRTIHKSVDLAEIAKALLHFYGLEKKREDLELKNINLRSITMSTGENSLPLRLGRHSGAESVTIAGHRSIKIGLNQPKYEKYATTIWLNSMSRKPKNLDGLQPMGWVTLASLSAKEISKLQADQQQALRDKEQKHKQQVLEMARQEEKRQQQQQEAESLRRRREQEKAAKEKKEAELTETWGGMADHERRLALIQGTELALSQQPDTDIMLEIWPKIKEQEKQKQVDLAKAFADLWRGDDKKWRKIKCPKKQWQKVEQVVDILGESHPDIKTFSEDDVIVIAMIQDIADWGQYKNTTLNWDTMTLPQAEALSVQLKDWGCSKPKKKIKLDKFKAWQKLKKKMTELRS